MVAATRRSLASHDLGACSAPGTDGRRLVLSSGADRKFRIRTVYYVIFSEDVDDSLSRRQGARPRHLERLERLRDEGRLLVAGPCPAVDSDDPGPAGFSASVVIAEFDSLDSARAWADSDPYVEAGVYRAVTVKPFKAVLP